ncbi:hypothetical protein INR49_023502 [Caranx melampygus]|nr:hypothetical protein INR49_023502 [Caranx melampygus]
MMPRSFLVKRGGLHHPRPTAGGPSPGSTPVTLSQLKNTMGPWDTSLECSTAEAPYINSVSITLFQQDPPATSPSNGSGNLQPLSPRSYDYRHAKPFTPVNPNTFSPGERGNSGPPTTAIWSIPHESSGYPDKLSVGLGDLTQQPQFLRETRSSGSSKISAPRQECPLCRKVWHHSSAIDQLNNKTVKVHSMAPQ